MKVTVRKVKKVQAPKKVKVHRVKQSAVNKRRKLELIRMLDNIDPDL